MLRAPVLLIWPTKSKNRLLEKRMIYGFYPDVVNHPGDEADLLRELTNSYLYKDILTWERIQKPEKLERLDQALALQLGSEVSYNELGQTCGIDNETVEKYISLLEKAFRTAYPEAEFQVITPRNYQSFLGLES